MNKCIVCDKEVFGYNVLELKLTCSKECEDKAKEVEQSQRV